MAFLQVGNCVCSTKCHFVVSYQLHLCIEVPPWCGTFWSHLFIAFSCCLCESSGGEASEYFVRLWKCDCESTWKHLWLLSKWLDFKLTMSLTKKNVLSWIMNKVKCITPSALGNWRQTRVLLYKALEVHNFVNQNHYIFKSFICLKAVWTAK